MADHEHGGRIGEQHGQRLDQPAVAQAQDVADHGVVPSHLRCRHDAAHTDAMRQRAQARISVLRRGKRIDTVPKEGSTEQIFTIPGFGKLIVDAVFNRDYAVVQGVVRVTATTYIVLNLLADVGYILVNPRLRA